MKINKENGFVGVDMVIATIAIMIFSGLIISLMYSNALENLKLKKDALATIYLTETMENIGIAKYDEVVSENIEQIVPKDLEEKGYNINIQIISEFNDLPEKKDEDIIKKVIAKISYKLGNKEYEHTMERIIIKE